MASERKEYREWYGPDCAGVFPSYTWSVFAPRQGKGCLGIFVFFQNSISVTLALPLCPCVFMVEPLTVHAVEFFREELGSQSETLSV